MSLRKSPNFFLPKSSKLNKINVSFCDNSIYRFLVLMLKHIVFECIVVRVFLRQLEYFEKKKNVFHNFFFLQKIDFLSKKFWCEKAVFFLFALNQSKKNLQLIQSRKKLSLHQNIFWKNVDLRKTFLLYFRIKTKDQLMELAQKSTLILLILIFG